MHGPVAVETMTVFVPRDPATCWRVFTDAGLLPAWVPGLRRAQVITKERGLASEVHFEFASSLTYTLVYTYDRENREVSWQPKLGRRDGVSGFARFEPFDEGTRVILGLEPGDARSPAELELGSLRVLAEAFTTWVRNQR